MDFKKSKTANYFLQDTPIENLFIGEYMLDADGDFVKVYLLGSMCAQNGIEMDREAIAKKLSIDPSVVDAAWDYWEKAALVKKSADANGKTSISFVNLKEAVFGHCAAVTLDPAKKIEGDEIGKLFSSIEQVTGRTLESREPEMVASWIEEFGIDPSVVISCYRYCTEKGSSNRAKYVQATLMAWNEKGLKTADQVEEYLSENDKLHDFYKRIFKELGFNRSPSVPEKEKMRTWFNDMQFSLDKVLEACKKTTGISSPNINYLDSILTSWYKESHSDAQEIAPETSLSKVERRYAQLREENAEKTKALREKIYDEIPRLRDIAGEISSARFAMTKAALAGARFAKQKAADEVEKLTAEKNRLLKENGYRENALDAIFTCSKCQDTGILEDGSRCNCYADRLKEIQ